MKRDQRGIRPPPSLLLFRPSFLLPFRTTVTTFHLFHFAEAVVPTFHAATGSPGAAFPFVHPCRVIDNHNGSLSMAPPYLTVYKTRSLPAIIPCSFTLNVSLRFRLSNGNFVGEVELHEDFGAY